MEIIILEIIVILTSVLLNVFLYRMIKRRFNEKDKIINELKHKLTLSTVAIPVDKPNGLTWENIFIPNDSVVYLQLKKHGLVNAKVVNGRLMHDNKPYSTVHSLVMEILGYVPKGAWKIAGIKFTNTEDIIPADEIRYMSNFKYYLN